MTEAHFSAGPALDAWERLVVELRPRRLFRVALAVLVGLCGLAIYAPLLASDRPYLLDAVHVGDYERARQSLVPVARALQSLAVRTEAEFLAQRGAGSSQSYGEALAAERSALATRVETLTRQLPGERSPALETLLDGAERTSELARGGDRDAAAALAGALVVRAEKLREQLDPARNPLVSRRSYPLFAALTASEIFFMVLWACVLSFPLWNRALERGRRARRKKPAIVLGFALACGLAWQLAVGGGAPFHTGNFKSGLTSGEIRATRVLFPPLAYGFAETHPEEAFRPPTWTQASEMSSAGAYLRGARVPRPDPVTGFLPGLTPVEIRAGEPGLNSPWRHPLGTDSLGRDQLVRLCHGARVSLAVGLVSTALLMTIGIAVGALAGFFGGRTDLLLSRALEVVISFPILFLILVTVAFVGPSIWNVMLVIGCVGWTGAARLTRGEFLRLRELDFVVAARALGFGPLRIVLCHLLPNALGPLFVTATFSVAAAILIESALSFLGFGIRVPIPSWGSLANESREISYWWIQVFPGLFVFVTVLCVNLVGDALRDALDPHLRT